MLLILNNWALVINLMGFRAIHPRSIAKVMSRDKLLFLIQQKWKNVTEIFS